MKNFSAILLAVVGGVLFSCNEPTKQQPADQEGKVSTMTTALDSLNILIGKDSLNAELYHARAQFYINDSDPNRALADINKAIQLNDSRAGYYVTLADIYLTINMVPNCLEALQKAMDLDPGNNDALLKLAEVYLILKDYQSTFKYTGMALDKERINPIAFFIRGYAYMETGDTALAVKSFQAAVEQKQDYYAAYVQLGILFSISKNALAIGYLQTATRIDPNRTEAWYLLALAFQEQENFPKAVETYNQLLSIDPVYKEAYFNLGYINLVYTEDYAAAINYFNKAIEVDPKYTDAFFNRGYSYELSGDIESARKDYQKALQLEPNYDRSIQGLNRLDEGK